MSNDRSDQHLYHRLRVLFETVVPYDDVAPCVVGERLDDGALESRRKNREVFCVRIKPGCSSAHGLIRRRRVVSIDVDQARERPAGPSEKRHEASSNAYDPGQKRKASLSERVVPAVLDAVTSSLILILSEAVDDLSYKRDCGFA